MADKNSSEAVSVALLGAHNLAAKYEHRYVTVEHLIRSLLEDESVKAGVKASLKSPDTDIDDLINQIDEYFADKHENGIEKFQYIQSVPEMSQTVTVVIAKAAGNTVLLRDNSRKPQPMDVLAVCWSEVDENESPVMNILSEEIDTAKLVNYAKHGKTTAPKPKMPGMLAAGGEASEAIVFETEEEALEYLAKYATNLNDRAKEGKIDRLIGREKEVERVIQVLNRRNKPNPVMLGEAGVGKTQIAEGIAQMIVEETVPESLLEAVIWSLEIGSLVAGTRYRGDLEERTKNILAACQKVPNIILFIDEIHTLLGAGGTGNGSLDVSNIMKPALARGDIRCIGSTTFDEFTTHFEKDKALVRRFKKVEIDEPSIADAKLIMRGVKKYYEEFHGVEYTDAALDAAVELSVRYVFNSHLPDKAIDILDEAGAAQKSRPADERLKVIDVRQIETEIAKVARIPERMVSDDESEKMNNMIETMSKKVFGQDTAIEKLTDAVMISRAGLRETNKTTGTFLFSGPTGVGKTEVAKVLASELGLKLVRFDMSEYMEPHSVSKLIGAPPGYVGYNEAAGSGMLLNEIERNPHCVLLLDEVEKAHPSIFNVLLQVTSEGFLTSSKGKKVSFSNVILIMTTNAGAEKMASPPVGFGNKSNAGADMEAIKKMFTPEMRNRLDEIVAFNTLNHEHMLLIVNKFLENLAEMAGEKGVEIEVDQAARDLLVDKGFNAQFGARPLDRQIHTSLKKPLSRAIILGDLKKGGTFKVSVKDGDFDFEFIKGEALDLKITADPAVKEAETV